MSGIGEAPRRVPLLFVPDGVLLPGASMRFLITTPKNKAMVKSRLLSRGLSYSPVVGVFPREADHEAELGKAVEVVVDLAANRVGAAAEVVQVTATNWPRHAYSLLVTGLCRIRLEKIVEDTPFLVGSIRQIDRLSRNDTIISSSLETRISAFKDLVVSLLTMLDTDLPTANRLKEIVDNVSMDQLADIIGSIVKANYSEKIEMLNAVSLEEKLEKAFPLLKRQIEGLKTSRGNNGLNKTKVVQQRKKIDWDMEDDGDEIEDLEKKLKAANLPEKPLRTAVKELKRLKKMSAQMPEYPMLRHYLELLAELPWKNESQESVDIGKARQDLDRDHYALDKVKKRVLEYLAVRKLNPSLKGPILCFVGPPGVGKTSIANSIAQTLGRKFHRISLGGVSDQSDIRGHRRTYIGAMPGRLIQAVKAAGTNNPLLLLDEVDKMSSGIHGDPAAALLEVLDPHQNYQFLDHYVNLPFDLSQVLFIATANSLSTVSRPLLDRLEIITVPGYTLEDKIPIARLHLLPRQYKEHGLQNVSLHDQTIKFIISRYTREAGVRGLERQLGALCRALAVKAAEAGEGIKPLTDKAVEVEKGIKSVTVVTQEEVQDILGDPLYSSELTGRLGVAGVAVGLAWTPVGGEVMIVEAGKLPCTGGRKEGRLHLTGQLGEVMKESAAISLAWVRGHAHLLGLEGAGLLDGYDIHLHFPAGGVEKEGPSAGVTITVALVSLLTGKPVDAEVAMTGEVTLHGLVLGVGGVRDKVLAASRMGLSTVVIPQANIKDLHQVPDHIKSSMKFVGVKSVEEVLQVVFEPGFTLLDASKSLQCHISKL